MVNHRSSIPSKFSCNIFFIIVKKDRKVLIREKIVANKVLWIIKIILVFQCCVLNKIWHYVFSNLENIVVFEVFCLISYIFWVHSLEN